MAAVEHDQVEGVVRVEGTAYDMHAWPDQVLGQLGRLGRTENGQFYDKSRFVPYPNEVGLREMTGAEIAAYEELARAYAGHPAEPAHPEILNAYREHLEARESASRAESLRNPTSLLEYAGWVEREDFLVEFGRQRGAGEPGIAELRAALGELREELDRLRAAPSPAALPALDWLLQHMAQTAEQQPTAENPGSPGPSAAMGDVLESCGEFARTEEFEQITSLWQLASRFGKAARALSSRYGEQLAADVRWQGLVRTVGERVSQGIAVASNRLAAKLSEAGHHGSRAHQALLTLSHSARDFAAVFRGEHPGDHLAEFDDLSDEIKALRESLTPASISLAPSELEGADAVALAGLSFSGGPGQRLSESAASRPGRREAADPGRGPAADLGR